MKILIVSSYIFGYIDFLVEELRNQGYEVQVMYYEKDPLLYQYKNFIHKSISGILKIFGINLKKKNRFKGIYQVNRENKFDKTIVIHGQYLNNKTHVFLKSISHQYIAFLFDSMSKMPRQKRILPFFDKIFSYEPRDCKEYGFQFLTNFIPTEIYRSKSYKYDIFNISSHDNRLSILGKMADYFNQKGINYKFILVSKRIQNLKNFQVIRQRINTSEAMSWVKESKSILDIQRNDQTGLSFRPFEALGNEKKLITNNSAIKDYDFYNPNNICLIDEEDIFIPKEFFESEYEKVPDGIYEKYTIRGWIKNIVN
ncbi:MAG: hypothetical protein ACK5IC_07000 [Moheibacter sp.]